jgi:hypothetical protein
VAEDGGEVFLGQWLVGSMKIAIPIIVFVLVALWLGIRLRAQTSPPVTKTETGQKSPADPKDVYVGLRNTMLQGPRSKFGLAAPSTPTEPWGVLMDWGVRNGTATVVASSDGSASVYFSSGGGYIGGKGQEPIRAAAQKAVEIARTVKLPERPTAIYPLPETHGVFFYFLTDAGVFIFRTSEQELNSPAHPLRKIGDAMQGVITEYRLWDQNGRPGGGGELRKTP